MSFLYCVEHNQLHVPPNKSVNVYLQLIAPTEEYILQQHSLIVQMVFNRVGTNLNIDFHI